MSGAVIDARPPEVAAVFSPRTILALVLVGVVSFAGLALLAVYAPQLRGSADPGAHALSSSAVGFKGAMVMLRAEGVTTLVSRTDVRRLGRARDGLVVLTPSAFTNTNDLAAFLPQPRVLIVLPKWQVAPHPTHIGWVMKAGAQPQALGPMLAGFAKVSPVVLGDRVTRPRLHGAGGPFQPGTYLPLGPIDQLQTLSGDGWTPALVDE
ncbi:MAG: hypothetical protein JSS35_02805, partial [Proteobacteria bacterium]|nr:hypothetical protein [Pseudomonadota bacterium]